MRILNSVYKLILDSVPEYMPETGGMLGGQDDTITTVVFDNGKIDDFRRCHYTPDVARLNRCLLDWERMALSFLVCSILISMVLHHFPREILHILKRY